MKLQDIMTKNVEVIGRSASLTEAAKKMKELNVGSLPVVEAQQVLGMITDRDIVVRAVADGMNPSETMVAAAMTDKLVFGVPEMDVKDAAKLMQEQQIRRLPVVDHENHLIGIVALGDISVEDGKLSGQILETISKPAKPTR